MSILSLFKRKPKPQPLVITDTIGTFTLKNPEKDSTYEGTVNWCGEKCFVHLNRDSSEALTADKALRHLQKLLENAEEWDKRLKEFSADDMAEEDGTVEIWGSSEENSDGALTVTREEYISRMSVNFVDISPDGNMFFDFGLDEMFTDHGMGIDANISGEIISSGLWG